MHHTELINHSTDSTYGHQVYQYIEKRFSTTLKLDDVARHFNLNKCYFCSVLKKETGMTFTQIVREVRVEKSKLLLTNSNLSTLTIALTVGFNNQNYFNSKRVIIIRIEKKQDSLYTKGTLNLAFYLQFS